MITNHKPETKTIIKAIFAWEDEKEEKWLEEMAAQGWKLISVAPYVYKFQRSAPEKVVFRLDYKLTTDKDYQEYLSIFKDAGWEMFATFANWHYFKIKPENQETPEIFNSGKAKGQKYRRLLWGLLPFLPIYLVILNPAFGFFESESPLHSSGFYIGIRIFFAAFIIFMIYAVIRIWIKIRKLESQSKE